jgi:transcriptional regulator with XRE-family HTH domain
VLPRAVVRGKRNPLHHAFSLRLTRARKAAGMNGAALSLAVGMAHNTSGHLEAGDRIPRVDTVEKLAAVLHVSPCFLAYGIEQPCEAGDGSLSVGLPARLAQLRQERGLSPRDLGRLAGTSHTFVRDTEAGSSVPNIAKVEALANALKVSACWMAYGVGERDSQLRRRPPAQPTAPSR